MPNVMDFNTALDGKVTFEMDDSKILKFNPVTQTLEGFSSFSDLSNYSSSAYLGARALVGSEVLVATSSGWKSDSLPTFCANSKEFAGGADKTGVTPSTDAINACAQAVAATGKPGVVLLEAGDYLLDSTCFIPASVFVVGAGAGNGGTPLNFKPKAGATFTGGWMFMFNSTDGTTAASNVYQHNYLGGMIGARLNNYSTNYANIRGAICFGSGFFQDIRSYKLMCAIKRPANYYCDRWVMIRCSSDQEYNGTTEYQLDLDGTGDTVLIDRCTFPDSGGVISEGGTSPIKAVRIRNSVATLSCASATIRGSINGDHYFRGVKALKVENFHVEYGVTTFDQSNFSFEDSYIAIPTGTSTVPIVCVGEGYNSSAFFGKLKNIETNWGWNNFRSSSAFELKTHPQYNLTIENCFRVTDATASGPSLTGFRVCKNDDSALTQWNSASHILSQFGELSGYSVKDRRVGYTLDSSYGGIFFVGTSNNQNNWDAPTGTYYYTTQYIIDSTNSVGLTQTSAEAVANISSVTNAGAFMNISTGNLPASAIIRVYRGTASGSYSKYADIPAVMVRLIQDTGTRVNGILWADRTAGPVDSMKSGSASGSAGEWIYSTATNSARRANTVYLARTDSNGSYGAYSGHNLVVYTGALTANRFIGAPSNAKAGDTARIVRSSTATGASTVTVQGLDSGGSGSRTLSAVNTFVELYYDGSIWICTASGSA